MLCAGLLFTGGCSGRFNPQRSSEPAETSASPRLVMRLDRWFKSPINQMRDDAVPFLAAYDDGTVILAGQSPTGKVSAKASPDAITRAVRAVELELTRKRPLGESCQIFDNMVVEVHVPAISDKATLLDEVPGISCDSSDPRGRPDLLAAITSAQQLLLESLNTRTPYLERPQLLLTPGGRLSSTPATPVTPPWPLPIPFTDSQFHRNCISLDRNNFDNLIAAVHPSGPISRYLVRTGAARPFPAIVGVSLDATLPNEQPCGGLPLIRTVPSGGDRIDPAVWAPLGSVDEVGEADLFASWNLDDDATAAITSRYGEAASFGGYGTKYRAARVDGKWYLDGYDGLGIGKSWWLVRTDPLTGKILTIVAGPGN